ncbi:MAG: phage terminase large subunit [Vampirovibrionales bacterium]|nr:phage terminase large subunit [Vampirovibrionales bacterium]
MRLRRQLADILRIVAFHDPALADSTDGDDAALVVALKDRQGYVYCLDAIVERVPPSQQIEQALLLQKKYGFETLYLETNCFQGLLKTLYQEAIIAAGVNLRVIGISQQSNKIKRVSSLEPLIANGHLLFTESLSPRFWQQMTLFPTGKDDGPDALQGAVEQLKRPLGQISFHDNSTTGLF